MIVFTSFSSPVLNSIPVRAHYWRNKLKYAVLTLLQWILSWLCSVHWCIAGIMGFYDGICTALISQIAGHCENLAPTVTVLNTLLNLQIIQINNEVQLPGSLTSCNLVGWTQRRMKNKRSYRSISQVHYLHKFIRGSRCIFTAGRRFFCSGKSFNTEWVVWCTQWMSRAGVNFKETCLAKCET